jgi:hypothetical protein
MSSNRLDRLHPGEIPTMAITNMEHRASKMSTGIMSNSQAQSMLVRLQCQMQVVGAVASTFMTTINSNSSRFRLMVVTMTPTTIRAPTSSTNRRCPPILIQSQSRSPSPRQVVSICVSTSITSILSLCLQGHIPLKLAQETSIWVEDSTSRDYCYLATNV